MLNVQELHAEIVKNHQQTLTAEVIDFKARTFHLHNTQSSKREIKVIYLTCIGYVQSTET